MPDSQDPQVPAAQGNPSDSGATTDPSDSGQQDGAPKTYATWAEFAAEHPEAAALHEADKASLKKALDSERDKAKEASAKLRELAKTADPTTAEALRKAAEEKDAELELLKRQLDFQSAAIALGCRTVDKAWAMAQATGMTVEQMKNDPDLAHWFTAPQTPGAPRVSAGAGSSGQPAPKEDFNSLLRRAVGAG